MSPIRRSLFVVTVLLFTLAGSLHAVDASKSLSPRYRHWLTEEVPYIISSDERQQFLSLKSDAERDNFIQAFWAARNPNPGSDVNEYKQEYYRRLAYANDHFGNTERQDGWRSDMGRIYITLGAPQQRTTYPNAPNVRPIVIWFYESPTPALPAHFYVMFYKRSAGDPYTLYSPYQDGPVRLTTGLEDLNDQKRALQTIRKALGDEVATISLSLIPSEPVNLNDYSPSMSSDVLLANIKGLPDNPVTKEALELRRSREVVSSRILFGAVRADMQTATFRDDRGRQTSSLLLVPQEPIQNLIGTLPDKTTGYALMLETTVSTKAGKRVYQLRDGLHGILNEDQAASLKEKRFGVEERLPLVPGDYQISTVLTNELTHVGVQEQGTLVVPDLSKESWGISRLVAFSQREARPVTGATPFSVSGMRFPPRGVGESVLHPGDPLWVAYQLWGKPKRTADQPAHAIRITYSYGLLQGGQAPKTDSEDIDTANADAMGDLMTGHKIDTTGLTEGNYRLVVTATDAQTGQKAYTDLMFRIVPFSQPAEMWTAYDAQGVGARSDAMDDYKRGLSALAQAQNDVAEACFRRALATDAGYLPALDRLVDVLTQSNKLAEVAALANEHPPTRELNEQTAILMAEANGAVGKPDAGVQLLEAELKIQAPNQQLYLALAKLYETGGNAEKAQEYRKRAAAIKN